MSLNTFKFHKKEIEFGPRARIHHLMANIGTKIYVIGGESSLIGIGDKILFNDIWSYSIDTLAWKKEGIVNQDLYEARKSFSFVVFGKNIIISGGISGNNNTLSDLIVYNVDNYGWKKISTNFRECKNCADCKVCIDCMKCYNCKSIDICKEYCSKCSTFYKKGCCRRCVSWPALSGHSLTSVYEGSKLNVYTGGCKGSQNSSNITLEGLYMFGGRMPDGSSTNRLHII